VLSAGTEATEWPVWRYVDLPTGMTLDGPGIVEYPGSTLVLPDGWRGSVDAVGNIVAVKN